MKTYFNYTLKKPISIAIEGNNKEASSLIVKSPRPKDAINALALEAIFTQAMMKSFDLGQSVAKDNNILEQSKKIKEKESEDQAADSLVQLIMMGVTQDNLKKAIDLLRDLMCAKSVEPQATIDNVKFTTIAFEQLSLIDLKALLGRYIYHFLSSNLT